MDDIVLSIENVYAAVYEAEVEHKKSVRPILVRMHPESIMELKRNAVASARLLFNGEIISGLPVIADTTISLGSFRLCYEVDYGG